MHKQTYNYLAPSDPHRWDLPIKYNCGGGHGILERPGDLAVGYRRWGWDEVEEEEEEKEEEGEEEGTEPTQLQNHYEQQRQNNLQ